MFITYFVEIYKIHFEKHLTICFFIIYTSWNKIQEKLITHQLFMIFFSFMTLLLSDY